MSPSSRFIGKPPKFSSPAAQYSSSSRKVEELCRDIYRRPTSITDKILLLQEAAMPWPETTLFAVRSLQGTVARIEHFENLGLKSLKVPAAQWEAALNTIVDLSVHRSNEVGRNWETTLQQISFFGAVPDHGNDHGYGPKLVYKWREKIGQVRPDLTARLDFLVKEYAKCTDSPYTAQSSGWLDILPPGGGPAAGIITPKAYVAS